jgi:hypothetical protein
MPNAWPNASAGREPRRCLDPGGCYGRRSALCSFRCDVVAGVIRLHKRSQTVTQPNITYTRPANTSRPSRWRSEGFDRKVGLGCRRGLARRCECRVAAAEFFAALSQHRVWASMRRSRPFRRRRIAALGKSNSVPYLSPLFVVSLTGRSYRHLDAVPTDRNGVPSPYSHQS